MPAPEFIYIVHPNIAQPAYVPLASFRGYELRGWQLANPDDEQWLAEPPAAPPLDVITRNELAVAMADEAATPGSPFSTHLADSIAQQVDDALEGVSGTVSPDPLPPLTRIGKAATGPFRIMAVGTSKAVPDASPVQVIPEVLKTTYGDSNIFAVRGGILGGSLTSAYLGWSKQRYSGPYQGRSVGTSSSTADQTFYGYGDQIVIECSRETDSEAADILIDGVVVGQTPAAGAQAYSQAQTFTVAEGPHRLTIARPVGAGRVYFEHAEFRTSTRTGVELRDCTLGGSTLAGLVNTPAPASGQLASIPVVGDNGINSHFARTDVDLYLFQYVVNDAGLGPLTDLVNVETVFKPTMDKVIAATAATRTPILVVIEMGGHYSLPNDLGNGQRYAAFNAIRSYLLELARTHNHVTVMDWHAATIMDDLAAYAARYFPGVSNLNVSAGTYTGDFIHEGEEGWSAGRALLARILGLGAPRLASAAAIATERVRRLAAGIGLDRRAVVGGTAKRFATPSGPALALRGTGDSTRFQGAVVPYYRDAAATNQAASTQALIDASGTSHPVYGKYLDSTLRNMGLGSFIDWANGAKATVTIKASGTFSVRVSGVTNVYANGVLVPRTDIGNDRTNFTYTVVGDEPVVFTFVVGASANNGNVAVSGRLYEVAITNSDTPLLVATA